MATVTRPMPGAIESPPDEVLFEVIDGRIEETPPMGAYEGRVASSLQTKLDSFVEDHQLGQVVTEVLFDLRPVIARSRRPDVAFVGVEKWPLERPIPDEEGWPVVPDLAVEVVSPTNRPTEVLDKILEYFRAGSRRVWIVYPRNGQLYAYDSPKSVRILFREDELAEEGLFPGFRLPLAELFGPERPRD